MFKKTPISLSLFLSLPMALNCAQSADENLPYTAIVVPSSPQGGEYSSDDEMEIDPSSAYPAEQVPAIDVFIETTTIAPAATTTNTTPLYLNFPTPNHPSAKVNASLNSFQKAFRSFRPAHVTNYQKSTGTKQITRKNPQNNADLMTLETNQMISDIPLQTQNLIETTATTPVSIESNTSVQPNPNPIQAGGHGGAMRNPLLNGARTESKFASFAPYSRPPVFGIPMQMDLASASSFNPAQLSHHIPPFHNILPPKILAQPLGFPTPSRFFPMNSTLIRINTLQPMPPIQSLKNDIVPLVSDQPTIEKKQTRQAKGAPVENNIKPEVENCRNKQRDFFDAMTNESVMAGTGLTLAAFNQLSRDLSVYYYNQPIIRHAGNLYFIETLVYIYLENALKKESSIFSRYAELFGSKNYTCNLRNRVLKIIPLIGKYKNQNINTI